MNRREVLAGIVAIMATPIGAAFSSTKPSPADILLDVAQHRPDLLVRINTQEELTYVNVDPVVRSWMVQVIATGGWIVTTKTPVAFGIGARNVGTPWIIVKGPAQGIYLNYDVYPAQGGDPIAAPGIAESFDGASIGSFGADLAAIGMGIAQLADSMGPRGKSLKGFGLGVAAIGMALQAYGLEQQIASDAKRGHVDPNEPNEPTGMPSAGGPPGTDPNGPNGPSPAPGQPSNANGNTPSGGASGGGGDGGSDDGESGVN